MNRVSLNIKNNKELVIDSNNRFLLDVKEINNPLKIRLEKGVSAYILIINIDKEINLTFDADEGSSLTLSVLAENSAKPMKITANMAYSSKFAGYLADFFKGSCKGEITINLNGENSTCEWHLASLSDHDSHKEFDVSVFHNKMNTFATMDNYGVCRDEAKLIFSGISKIEKGSSSSKTHQNAKIMVFDEKSNGIAKPILKIDENDIEASHAAIVGKISDEHIFYLTSRGLTEDEAKQLITFGYLKPILKGFDDEEIIARIEKQIEG